MTEYVTEIIGRNVVTRLAKMVKSEALPIISPLETVRAKVLEVARNKPGLGVSQKAINDLFDEAGK